MSVNARCHAMNQKLIDLVHIDIGNEENPAGRLLRAARDSRWDALYSEVIALFLLRMSASNSRAGSMPVQTRYAREILAYIGLPRESYPSREQVAQQLAEMMALATPEQSEAAARILGYLRSRMKSS